MSSHREPESIDSIIMDMQIKLRYINEISGGALFNEGSRMRSEAAVGVTLSRTDQKVTSQELLITD